jgi:hypothetical protein
MKKGKKLNLKPKRKPQTASVTPTYNPDVVIPLRTYGIKDLKAHIEKIKKNIKIFEEAINKEKALMKRDEDMIKVLKNDIKEARMFKRIKKLKN